MCIHYLAKIDSVHVLLSGTFQAFFTSHLDAFKADEVPLVIWYVYQIRALSVSSTYGLEPGRPTILAS